MAKTVVERDVVVENTGGDAIDPLAVVEGIETRKKERKKRVKREKTAVEADETIDPKYITAKNCGRAVNLVFQLGATITKYPNFALDIETRDELGEALSDVLRGFFPYTKENEKYAALYTLLTVFAGTMSMKVAEWKLATRQTEATEKNIKSLS